MEFIEFPKIARLSREMIVTEKIDGTNAQICILEEKDYHVDIAVYRSCNATLYIGSRTRWITPGSDNHGFAKWAYDHAEELIAGLGPGRHFGEWWGSGINRGYGLQRGDKRFSLFNTVRWCLHGELPKEIQQGKYQDILPECCGLVPELWRGEFDTLRVDECLGLLRQGGSYAAPGYMNPEGVVVFHVAGNVAFKKTLENDGHKGG